MTGLTTATWMLVPPTVVLISELIATQKHLHLASLVKDSPSMGADPLPHVVLWRGGLYVEDGHHRIVKAAMRGKTHVVARVFEV